MGEAPDVRDIDCPSAEVCHNGCDLHPAAPEPGTGTREALAEVLGEHRLLRDLFSPYCACGKYRNKRDDGTGHAAHLAAALAPVIARNEAEAREAERERIAAAMSERHRPWVPDDSLGVPYCVECGEQMPCHVLTIARSRP